MSMPDNLKEIADHISAVCVLLYKDNDALKNSQEAIDRVRKSRSVLQQLMTADERKRLLDTCTSHEDQVFKKSSFALLVDDLPLEDIAAGH